MLSPPARTAIGLAATLMLACGGPQAARPPAEPSGDPARGKVVFTTSAQPACSTCHTVRDVAQGTIGPDLTRIGTAAAERLRDPAYGGRATDAAGYVRESITDPNAYIAPACPAGGSCVRDVMPKDFATKLSARQLNDLIAYLLTLR